MQASWAVVLPYSSATQSGVIPVAYWNACPVIVTRVGALEETVRDGETGFMVERGDVPAVADRMLQLSGDRALRWRLGGGAFSFYDRWLRWERIAHDLVTAFHPSPKAGGS
jgi:glycosyltransferase involved in cell wall biosynthesis